MNTTINRTRLIGAGSFAELQSPIRALLFGVLADIAAPIVQRYRSDLYHDARYVAEHVNGVCEFQYCARENGTHIGTGLAETLWHAAGGSCESGTGSHGALCRDTTARLFRVTLSEERGTWFATTEEIAR